MRYALALLFSLSLCIGAWAQDKTYSLFYVPLKFEGNVKITEKEFNEAITRTISEVTPHVVVTVGKTSADNDGQALDMARKAGCQFVLYGKVEATKDSMLISVGAPGDQPGQPMTISSPQRYLVFLRGLATVRALDVPTRELLAAQPESFYRSRTSVVDDEKVETTLSADFIEQLSHRIIENLAKRIRRDRANLQPK